MRIAFRNFTGGEVTPSLSARYDLQKFGSFLSCCENFIPNLHGDIEKRPGTRFVAALGAPSALVPFQFNTDEGNNFVLIFQKGSIKVGRAGGLLANVSIPSPYELNEVYEMSTAQAGDVVYLAHRKHPLRKIMRSGSPPDYEWKLEEVMINRSLEAPDMPVVEFVRDNDDDKDSLNYILRYVVTAVDETGAESLASASGECDGKFPTDWVVGNHVNISWQAVNGATEYNIYRESAGYFGLIGVADGKNATGGKVVGLKVGTLTAGLADYVGSISRTVVIGNGHAADIDREDKAIRLAPGGNAFVFEGRLIVRVKRTTETTEWNPVYEDGLEKWEATIMNSEEWFWVMADMPSGNQLAQWSVGDADGKALAPTGSFGPYTVTPLYEGATTITFQDQNFEADTSITPKEDWNPFADGNNPGVVAFHQQRLALGGTEANPATFYMSRSGDYENFRKSRPLMDDDPVEYMLASGSIDEIRWMASFGDLLIGTSGAEYKATSSGAAITPNDIQISAQSYWGSGRLMPMIIGQSVMHCQRAGAHVRDLFYSWESDGYAGNDLSLLAPQLVENRRLVQWCFQQSPGSNIWVVRDDGVLLCLTYMKEQNVFGWSRHITQGKILSVASLCGPEEDRVMLVVERELRGKKAWFLEMLAPRFRDEDGIEDAFFLDCGLAVAGEMAKVHAGFSHLEGHEVQVVADGTPIGPVLVENGEIELPFPAKKVSAGFNYTSLLSPLPPETDGQNGSTLGKRRAYGKCVLRLFRSVGGSYAASGSGDLFASGNWKERQFYDLPCLPQNWGEAAQPFSGDVEITLPCGQDADTSICLRQDKPLPFRLVAIMADVDFGEN